MRENEYKITQVNLVSVGSLIMACCCFVCGRKLGSIRKPLAKSMRNHTRRCIHCGNTYKPLITNSNTENVSYLSAHLESYSTYSSYSFSTSNLPFLQTSETPKTPKIDDTDIANESNLKQIIKYVPSKSGIYTTNAPNTSMLVQISAIKPSPTHRKTDTMSTLDTIKDDATSPIYSSTSKSKYIPPPMHKFNQLDSKKNKKYDNSPKPVIVNNPFGIGTVINRKNTKKLKKIKNVEAKHYRKAIKSKNYCN